MPYNHIKINSITKPGDFEKPFPAKGSRNVLYAMKMSKLGGPGKKSPRYVSNRSAKAYRRNQLLGKTSTPSNPLPKRTQKTKDGIASPRLVRSGRQTMKARRTKPTIQRSKTTRNSSMKPPALRRTRKRVYPEIKN